MSEFALLFYECKGGGVVFFFVIIFHTANNGGIIVFMLPEKKSGENIVAGLSLRPVFVI